MMEEKKQAQSYKQQSKATQPVYASFVTNWVELKMMSLGIRAKNSNTRSVCNTSVRELFIFSEHS